MREFQALTLIKSLVGFESESGFQITDTNLLASEKEMQIPANSYQCTIKHWTNCIEKVELPKTFEDNLHYLLSSSAQIILNTVKKNSVFKKDLCFNIKNNGTFFDKPSGQKYIFDMCVETGQALKFMLMLNGTFAETAETAILTVGEKQYYLPQEGGTIITDSLEAGSYDCSLEVFGAHSFRSKSYETSNLSMGETPIVGTLDIGVDFEAVCSSLKTEIAEAMIARIRATMLTDCNMSIRSNPSQRSAEIAIEKQAKVDDAMKAYDASTNLLSESVKRLSLFNTSTKPTIHTL